MPLLSSPGGRALASLGLMTALVPGAFGQKPLPTDPPPAAAIGKLPPPDKVSPAPAAPIAAPIMAVAPPHAVVEAPMPDGAIVQSEIALRRPLWNRLFNRDRPVSLPEVACLVDDLERDLFKTGVVAVKIADVWGQNRMTKFRVEYETEMAKNVTTFKPLLNAYTREADVATLTSATAIGAALPSTTTVRGGSTVNQITPPAAPINLIGAGASNPLPGPSPLLPSQTPVFGYTGTTNPTIPVFLDPTRVSTSDTTQPIALEPTIVLDEQSRYLYHLQQLRRINTGDDTADMPGYGLYLLRLPVSLLPGAKTFKGKGASVTVKASHYLTPDLLPTTFRDFVTNDLADELAPVISTILDLDDVRQISADDIRLVLATGYEPSGKPKLPSPQGCPDLKSTLSLTDIVHLLRASQVSANDTAAKLSAANDEVREKTIQAATKTYGSVVTATCRAIGAQASRHSLAARSPAGSGVRTAATATEIDEIMGAYLLMALAADIKESRENAPNRDFSVREWLRAEIKGSYDFLIRNRLDPNLSIPMIDAIGQLILRRDYGDLAITRAGWIKAIQALGNPTLENPPPAPCVIRPIESLAFGIIVTAYQLDRQLKSDITIMAQQKGCIPGNPEFECFYAFDPTPGARALYNAYIEAKWPVHVFAIDPVVDQQNVEDVSSVRRELQVALAVALATGQVNFDNAEQYARRLETDIETIGLNRTAVGFGAGDQVFGWKFYPRVQTHQAESNPRAIADLILFNGPGPYYDVRHRKMEPGLRECTALIVMPTFVSYLRLETATNWFGLTGKCAEEYLNSKDMLEMGHKVELAKAAISRLGQTCGYRATDVQGLMARVDQLEAQLPLQAQLVAFPYENTLNGSEVYTSGYSHLAPQLNDWYGTPAFGKEFSVFVSGKHFSVHETQVIAGGISLPQDKFLLASRDVMRITVPANAIVETRIVSERDPRTNVVVQVPEPTIDVHVVSPNGQSNHLLIKLPAPPPDCQAPCGFRWGLPTVYSTMYTFDPTISSSFAFPGGQFLLPPTNELVIEAPPGFTAPTTAATLVLTVESGGKVITTLTTGAAPSFDVKRNAYFIGGNDFGTVNTALMQSVTTAINGIPTLTKVPTAPSEPLIVSGKLYVGGAAFPIANKLTVGLTKYVKPQ
jgi:hypothetical protein